MLADLFVLADVIGTSSVDGLFSHNPESVKKNMAGLKNNSYIVLVHIFSQTGQKFVSYIDEKSETNQVNAIERNFQTAWDYYTHHRIQRPENAQIKREFFYDYKHIDILEPIIFDDKIIGAIYIKTLNKYSLFSGIMIIIAVCLVSLLLVFELMIRYQLKVHDDELRQEKSDLEISLDTVTEHADEMESELAEKNRLLEVEINDRKQIEQILFHAKEAAESANKAKSTFLANMSHELRTPLNGILGYTQILKRDKSLSDKHQDSITVIHRCGEYLLTLISDILDLSKIEADRIELYPTDFCLDDFLDDIVEIFEMRVKQKEIYFSYQKLSHLPEAVHADEKRLRQIIINLLSNAVKFTKEGGVSFRVGYHNGKIRFQVEDTGVGIAKNEIQYIFQPFKQVGDQNTRAEGTGLGLSITKKLVKMMGGELYVESTLGKGSIFWMEIDLPIAKSFVKINDNNEPIILGFKGEKRRILIVDDKEPNRTFLFNLLNPLGFEIIEAVNGKECVDKTVKYKPDLILIDLVMPIMDGFEATRQIRHIPEVKDTTIIMVSAGVFESHKEQSIDAGCDEFLPKPIHDKDLLKLLEKYLDLTWSYEKSQHKKETNKIESDSNTDKVVMPNPKQMEILFDLAMMGDLEGIVEKLEEFKKVNQALTPFTTKILKLVDQCEAEKVYDLIEQYMEDEKLLVT